MILRLSGGFPEKKHLIVSSFHVYATYSFLNILFTCLLSSLVVLANSSNRFSTVTHCLNPRRHFVPSCYIVRTSLVLSLVLSAGEVWPNSLCSFLCTVMLLVVTSAPLRCLSTYNLLLFRILAKPSSFCNGSQACESTLQAKEQRRYVLSLRLFSPFTPRTTGFHLSLTLFISSNQ